MAGTVARVTEISAKSDTSFDDAINVAVSRASQTLRGVTAAWVKEQNVDIEDGRIVAWKVDLLPGRSQPFFQAPRGGGTKPRPCY